MDHDVAEETTGKRKESGGGGKCRTKIRGIPLRGHRERTRKKNTEEQDKKKQKQKMLEEAERESKESVDGDDIITTTRSARAAGPVAVAASAAPDTPPSPAGCLVPVDRVEAELKKISLLLNIRKASWNELTYR